jgi:hypothetical protein
MPLKIGSLVFDIIFTAWIFLLAYRKIGKRPGQNAAYDEWMSFMSGTLKVMRVLGIITIVFSIIDLAVFSR